MAFLFKTRKQQNNAANASQSKDSPAVMNAAVPGTNAPPAPVRERERDPGRVQTPTPSSSVNNSLHSLAGDGTPSPEQKGLREKTDADNQGPRRAPNTQFPPNNANALLYPWSQRRLNFTTSHPSPFPRYGAAVNSVASKDGEVYLMGGLINGATVKGDLWMAEADGASLSCYPIVPKSEGPGPRVGHAALIVGNAFIVFGGDTKMDDQDILDDTLYLLNTSTRQWSRAVPAGPRPSGRYGHTLNIIGSKIYIFGGQIEGYFFNDLVAFDLNALQLPSNRWEVLIPNTNESGMPAGQVPPARTNHTVVSWNDKLYLFGGTNGLQWFNDVWAYDPRSNSWSRLDCIGYIPAPREGHAAAIVGDVMYIFGGRTEEANDLGDLAAFRISSRRWYTFQNMGPSPSPRSGHSMTAYGKQIVVLGGAPSSAPRDAAELSLVYLLDTDKIRYPNDQAPTNPQNDKLPGVRRPSGEKSGIPQSRGPPGRDGTSFEGKEQKRILAAPKEGAVGANNPFAKGSDTGPNGPSHGQGSRLPRASMSHAPSGPPPQQQAPPPRVNGVTPVMSGPRSKTPTRADRGFGPAIDTSKGHSMEKENESPVTRDSPSGESPVMNGRRTPTQQSKNAMKPREVGDVSAGGLSDRSRSRQAQQQGSLDSSNESPSTNKPTTGPPAPVASEGIPGEAPSRNESLDNARQSPLQQSPLQQQQHDTLLKTLEDLKSKNAWYASEMALARRAGYAPNMHKNSVLEEHSTETFAEDDRPLVEALLVMRAELVKVQKSVDTQAARAAQQIAEVERQRDVAVSEAVFAKAKFAAHGGSQAGTPQPENHSREAAEMHADRTVEMNRKLASALALQTELQNKVATLSRDFEIERQARQLAEETSVAAQSRVSELDTYRQHNTAEVERLRGELHEGEKQAREEALQCSEAVATSKMLQADNDDLKQKLQETLVTTNNHANSLIPLREAVVASTSKTVLLEKKIEEEREHHENVERKYRQLKADHEERTAELDTVLRKLKDAEELAESNAAEARSHREVMLAGLDKVSARDLDNSATEITDQRVMILQEQVEAANALVRKSQDYADTASEKLRRAEERIAGLEAYQEQASREGLTIRKQLQHAMKESQSLQVQNSEIKQQLASQQLDSNAIAVQHGALKDLLAERGMTPSDVRARSNTSPGSALGATDQARLRELEQQLELALQAHRETQNSFEIREQEAEKAYREKLEQLEVDYQSAVHYVKGTEKMLKRMKDELAKYKSQNARLQAELEESQRTDGPRSYDQNAPPTWENERQSLKNEIEVLQESVRDSVARLENQMQEVREELQATKDERDQYMDQSEKFEQEYASAIEHSRADLEQLQHENNLLESRAADAEQKVNYLLSQVETSVDNYRRQSRQDEPNGVVGHHHRSSSGAGSMARESMYGPDNRNSVALDSLASELDLLRSQWENTSKNYRLSNTFDFEKTPVSTEGGELSNSLANWRKKLDLEEQESHGRRLSKTSENESMPTKGSFSSEKTQLVEERPNAV